MISVRSDPCYSNYPGSHERHLATPLTYILTYLITYLLTLLYSELLEKLTGFPTSYGTQKFITAFTSARHPSLS